MVAKLLIGNTFPVSLIRRKALFEPVELEELKKRLQASEIFSFWGHSNTLAAASHLLGIDISPSVSRPVLGLSGSSLPCLAGNEFTEVWLLSPDYRENFRPAPGEEVTPDQIKSWQCLKITF